MLTVQPELHALCPWPVRLLGVTLQTGCVQAGPAAMTQAELVQPLGFAAHVNQNMLGPAPPRVVPSVGQASMWAHWEAMLTHLLMVLEVLEVTPSQRTPAKPVSSHCSLMNHTSCIHALCYLRQGLWPCCQHHQPLHQLT